MRKILICHGHALLGKRIPSRCRKPLGKKISNSIRVRCLSHLNILQLYGLHVLYMTCSSVVVSDQCTEGQERENLELFFRVACVTN